MWISWFDLWITKANNHTKMPATPPHFPAGLKTTYNLWPNPCIFCRNVSWIHVWSMIPNNLFFLLQMNCSFQKSSHLFDNSTLFLICQTCMIKDLVEFNCHYCQHVFFFSSLTSFVCWEKYFNIFFYSSLHFTLVVLFDICVTYKSNE